MFFAFPLFQDSNKKGEYIKMKKRIKGKLCDTETAALLGTKYVGVFGDTNGYEEQLYITRTKQYFMYGNGGSESKYTKATINLLADDQAEEWKKENITEVKSVSKKESVPKKKVNTTKKKATTLKKKPAISKKPEQE